MARLTGTAETVAAGISILSDAEKGRAKRFVFEADRRRFVIARARLRELLGARLGIKPARVELAYGEHGKPSLARTYESSRLRFNTSHCGDLAVYALATGREVGVDVEAVRWMGDAEEVAARFFSRRENRVFRSLDHLQKPLGFFNCWTRKEAFIKAIGDGLSYPLDRFDVSLEPGQPAKILRVDDTPGDQCGWRLESLSPAPGFVAAVVTQES